MVLFHAQGPGFPAHGSPSLNKPTLLSPKDVPGKAHKLRYREGGVETLQVFLLVRFWKVLFSLFSSHLSYTQPLTGSQTDLSACSRITKQGSIPACQSLRFISDWLGGITSCLPRVKPINKTTLLKKKKRKKPNHQTTKKTANKKLRLPDARDCYESAAGITIWEIIEPFLLAMKPQLWWERHKEVSQSYRKCFSF